MSNMMCDFTDADAIKVGKMIADGLLWRDVVDKLYPDTEYPELMMELTYERFCRWCTQQTPERLMEAFRPSDELLPCPFCGERPTEKDINSWNGTYQIMHECDNEWHMAVNTCLYFNKRSAIHAWNRRAR